MRGTQYPPARVPSTAVITGSLAFGGDDRRKKKAPRRAGRSPKFRNPRLRSLGLGVDDLGRLGADRDLARLHRLGDLADEIDVKQAVLQAGTLDLDVIGELEPALERARGNALVEHLAGLLGLDLLFAADRQRAFLDLQRQVGLGEPRDRKRDAIRVLARPLDIVGRIAGRAVYACDLVEERKQPVETDGGTIEGSKIECTHGMTSLSDMRWVHPWGSDRLAVQPMGPARTLCG